MKKKLIAAAVAPLMALLAFAPQSSAAGTTRYITISATGSVKVTPDAVRVNATVSVLSITSAIAKSEASKVSTAVKAALKIGRAHV